MVNIHQYSLRLRRIVVSLKASRESTYICRRMLSTTKINVKILFFQVLSLIYVCPFPYIGRVHIKISVNGNHIEIEKVEGLEPRQMQDMESGLKGVIKSGEELFDLAPDSIKKIIALTQDVSKLSKSDIVNHVSLKEVPSKVSTLFENSEKAKKIPDDLKFFLSFMRNLIQDIIQVLNTKKEGKDQGSEQGDGNNEA